ncbi:arylsulfotransferase family protein [Membranihabitans marinus]|uniref:arylsulfotransferase family protein n=1 Tax=Membranihabitans marinus TaxID=1227546 RepID=UPI001F01B891|nr:arylsulfotransferase family protein [Membranihabitans marinus]
MKNVVVKLLSMSFLGLALLFTSCNEDEDMVVDDVEETESYGIDTSSYILAIDSDNGPYLINHDGDKLFHWDLDGGSLGNDANLLDDGSMLLTIKARNPAISFGGYGGSFRKLNVDQSVDWEVSYYSDSYMAHHDVEYLSNGNIIFPVWEEVSTADAVEMGFSASRTIYPESIIEMNPITQEVVWDWHVVDHLVQDHDSSKDNYGVVANNPNKIDINYNSSQTNGDLMHFNGLTLDESNDLLYITVNNYSEVWVIDHSTSVEEAASSSGGDYGMGGDLLYRFGNPSTYDNVGSSTLNNVHYPFLFEGNKIMVYANNVYDNQSEIVEYELDFPLELVAGQDNEPTVTWTFTNRELYTSGLGSGVRMSNGNTLIGEGRDGTIWEISPDGEILWQNTDFNSVWRAYAFSKDSPAIQALGVLE